MQKRTVYVAHPISGDVQGNKARVREICRKLALAGEVIPCAPYLEACEYLDDSIPEERALGISMNTALFLRGAFDDVYLHGTKISNGMHHETLLAWDLGMPVIAKTAMTAKALKDMEHEKPDDTDLAAVILRLVKRLGAIDFPELAERATCIHDKTIQITERQMRLMLEQGSLKHDVAHMIVLGKPSRPMGAITHKGPPPRPIPPGRSPIIRKGGPPRPDTAKR